MCEHCEYHRDRVEAERKAAAQAQPEGRLAHLQLATMHQQQIERLESAHRDAAPLAGR